MDRHGYQFRSSPAGKGAYPGIWLEEKIETRLSDGLSALKPGEVHTMIAAGMGGGLVIHIMEKDPSVTAKIREFILQPQSEISKVRFYLEESGYRIVCEDSGGRGRKILSHDESGSWEGRETL